MEAHCECCHRPVSDCLVMRELRLYRTPEGRKQLREEYHEQLRIRGAERDAKRADDGWHQAQKHGVPYAALRALRIGPEDSLALKSAKEFIAAKDALFLLLLGPTGAGKTLAASLVAVDFCARWSWNSQPSGNAHSPLHYVEAATLTRLSSFDADAQRQVQEYRDCRLLVLEDAGDEGTELGKGVLVELLMHRHSVRRRTVLTANLRPDDFKARFGEAVADRIRATGIIPNLFGEKSRRARRGA